MSDSAALSYDEAQLLSSALELYQLLPETSQDKKTLELMAKDIVGYVSRVLKSPEGGFYSAEDADSLPTIDSTVKKEGAFYVWTAQQLDELLGADAELFKYHFGVRAEGNCDPRHDVQGELAGQVRIIVVGRRSLPLTQPCIRIYSSQRTPLKRPRSSLANLSMTLRSAWREVSQSSESIATSIGHDLIWTTRSLHVGTVSW